MRIADGVTPLCAERKARADARAFRFRRLQKETRAGARVVVLSVLVAPRLMPWRQQRAYSTGNVNTQCVIGWPMSASAQTL
jgi:hypothetical protein